MPANAHGCGGPGMGTDTVHLTYDPAFIAAINHDERIRQDVDMVTVRVNYRFGGPVVARY